MTLIGSQHEQLQQALMDAYRNVEALRQMVRVQLDKYLDTIAMGGNLNEIVFKLIETSQAEGWTAELIEAARKSKPGNPKLLAFAQQVGLAPSPPSPRSAATTQSNHARKPNLQIFETAEDSCFVVGDGFDSYNVGTDLVVYHSTGTQAKQPIGLLRVTAKNPNNLQAQAILIHPKHQIIPSLPVSKRTDQFRASDLIPAYQKAAGYLLEEKLVVLQPDIEVESETIIEALKPIIQDGKILDYHYFTHPHQMCVTQVSPSGKVARVELVTGEWPETGTVIFIPKKDGKPPSRRDPDKDKQEKPDEVKNAAPPQSRPKERESPPTRSENLWKIPIILVVLITLIASCSSLFFLNPIYGSLNATPTPTSTPTPTPTLTATATATATAIATARATRQSEVSIRVADSTRSPLVGAKVLLFFQGGSLDQLTDSNGIAHFKDSFSDQGQLTLIVEADGYQAENKTLSLPLKAALQIELKEREGESSSIIVRVVDDESGEHLDRAKVLLLVEGEIYSEYTDSNGIVQVTLPFLNDHLDAKMSISTNDHEPEYQNVTLRPNQVQDVRLTKEGKIVTSSEPTEDATEPPSAPKAMATDTAIPPTPTNRRSNTSPPSQPPLQPPSQPLPRVTSVPSPTPIATSVPSSTPRATSVPSSTATATSVPSSTATATSVPSSTSTATATSVPSSTPTATSVPSSTATATSVPSSTATATSVPTITSVPPCSITPDSVFDGFFDRNSMGCPTANAYYNGGYEPFNRGFMLYDETNQRIYVFNTSLYSWQWVSDQWQEGQNEISCQEAAVTGHPKRGFGLVWCQYPNIRDALGNSEGEEIPLWLTFQNTDNALLINIPNRGTRVALFNNGSFIEQ